MASLTNGVGKWPISFIIKGPSDRELVRIQNEIYI